MYIHNIDCKDKKEVTVKLEYTDVIDIFHALSDAIKLNKVQPSIYKEFVTLVDLLRIGRISDESLAKYINAPGVSLDGSKVHGVVNGPACME